MKILLIFVFFFSELLINITANIRKNINLKLKKSVLIKCPLICKMKASGRELICLVNRNSQF